MAQIREGRRAHQGHLGLDSRAISPWALGPRTLGPRTLGPQTLSPKYLKSKGPKGRGPKAPHKLEIKSVFSGFTTRYVCGAAFMDTKSFIARLRQIDAFWNR